ncbi:integrase, partial [Bdellovibrionota bacterium FG-2]
MSYQALKEYLVIIWERYNKLNKEGKTALLNEATEVTKLSRKHLIRSLNQPKELLARKKPSGRKPKYGRELLLPIIQYLWEQMERISARRMKAAYPDWLPKCEDPRVTPHVCLILEAMSASTLERILAEIRKAARASNGLSTTSVGSPSRFMKNKIPLNTFDAKIDRPGFLQADTVAHCGTSVEGQYLNTITLTDIDSAWTENRGIFTKKAHEVRRQFIDFEHTFPFEMLAVNVDNGSEFINTLMVNFMRRENGKKPIQFTRSRAYKKNDNCYVEQKNFTHVRELFGYERMEDPALVGLMNEIYKTCWNPLLNFFIPTFKLKEKIRIGARIVKKYDKPLTPYERLMKSPHL